MQRLGTVSEMDRFYVRAASSSILVDKSGTYFVKVTNQFGCENSDTININFPDKDNKGFYVPNAFTPNGDFLNDCFGIANWGSVRLKRFDIYNRWGNKVFSGNKTTDCWNGMIDGKTQIGSTFAYIIVAESACGFIERKGLVTIIQ